MYSFSFPRKFDNFLVRSALCPVYTSCPQSSGDKFFFYIILISVLFLNIYFIHLLRFLFYMLVLSMTFLQYGSNSANAIPDYS